MSRLRELTANPETLEADALIDQARAAIARGQRAEARRCLWAALKADSRNATAWLVLAALSSPRASLEYVARALDARPHDPIAHAALRWARKRLATPIPLRAARGDEAGDTRPAASFTLGLVLLAALVAAGAIAALTLGGGLNAPRRPASVAVALAFEKATATAAPSQTLVNVHY